MLDRVGRIAFEKRGKQKRLNAFFVPWISSIELKEWWSLSSSLLWIDFVIIPL